MFDAVSGFQFSTILCGIIWSSALGLAFGNFACSLVHRLPRGRLLFDKKPYCGNCGTLLQVQDLFPVVSALLLRHRCRYCHTPFPVSHTWTEALVALLFVFTYFEYGFSEQFLLITFLGTFLITLAAIEANDGIVMGRILLCIIVFGMLYRTLQDQTIYEFFYGGVVGGLISAFIWRKKITPVAHVFKVPKVVELVAIGGVCVGNGALILFGVLFGGFYSMDWLIRKITHSSKPPLMTVAFGLAIMLLILYPKLYINTIYHGKDPASSWKENARLAGPNPLWK